MNQSGTEDVTSSVAGATANGASSTKSATKKGGRAAKGGAQETVQVPSGFKTRKSFETRERIIRCAADFISTEGSSAALKMSDVSQSCGMSKGALYYYFTDKKDLIDAVYEHEMDDFIDLVNQAIAKAFTPIDAIKDVCNLFARRSQEGPLLTMAMVYDLSLATSSDGNARKSRFDEIASLVADEVKKAKEEGFVREEISESLSSISLCGALCFSALYARAGMGLPKDFADQLYKHAMYGIGV